MRPSMPATYRKSSVSNAGQIQRTRHAVANPAYAYDAFSLFQRACTYAYDALAHACMTNTYGTAATVVVIAVTLPRPSTPTTTNVPHRNGTIKNARKQDKHTINSLFTNDIGKENPPSTLQARTYGTSPTTYCPSTAATPTTTSNTIVTHATTTIETPPEAQPTTHPIHHYYGYRYYKPELGRWINRDPIGEMGYLVLKVEQPEYLEDYYDVLVEEHHLYAFIRNHTLNEYDILGLRPPGKGPRPGPGRGRNPASEWQCPDGMQRYQREDYVMDELDQCSLPFGSLPVKIRRPFRGYRKDEPERGFRFHEVCDLHDIHYRSCQPAVDVYNERLEGDRAMLEGMLAVCNDPANPTHRPDRSDKAIRRARRRCRKWARAYYHGVRAFGFGMGYMPGQRRACGPCECIREP